MAGLIPQPGTEELTFEADGFALRATLHLPTTPEPPVIIGSHGLLSDRSSPKQVALAEACTAEGMAFLRIDHRGCGQSAGRLEEDTSLEARANDVLHAIRFLESRPDLSKRVGLFGSSMGGAVCLQVAGCRTIDALVTFAAPVRSLPLRHTLPAAGDGDAAGAGAYRCSARPATPASRLRSGVRSSRIQNPRPCVPATRSEQRHVESSFTLMSRTEIAGMSRRSECQRPPSSKDTHTCVSVAA